MPLLTRSKISVPTMLGLVVALLSLFLISPILHFMGAPHGESVAGLVVEWALFAVLVLIIRFGEHLPLASIGLKPLGWRLALAGIMIGIGLLALITVTLQLLPAFGISVARSAAEAKAIIALPLGTRMVIVITAGIVEETFFRGYPIERLGAVFGSLPFAGLLSLVIFAAAHISSWGMTQAVIAFMVGAFLTLLYLWRRNLLLNIIAHIVTDGIALVLIPAITN
jgi:membrane protease YdiL (CAAX protease family)